MKRYEVVLTGHVEVKVTVEVDAENEDEAVDLAFTRADEGDIDYGVLEPGNLEIAEINEL